MSRIASSRPLAQKLERRPDKAYLAWLRKLPCIACVIDPRPAYMTAVEARFRPFIEAAHQKHTDLQGPSLGRRPADAASCPLCAWHHRLAPEACDPAQRRFWERLGVDIGAFCKALYDAFKVGAEGAAVVRRFAERRS